MRFPDLQTSAATDLETRGSVRVECTLIDANEDPLEAANLYLDWPGFGEPVLLTTDPEGRCAASWLGTERGTCRVTARYPGDQNHAPSSTSEEFELRGPVPTQLEVNISKPANDLPDIWGTVRRSRSNLCCDTTPRCVGSVSWCHKHTDQRRGWILTILVEVVLTSPDPFRGRIR